MKSGFTLVEVLVVTLVFGIVLGGLFTVMSTGRDTWYFAEADITLQQELRKAMRAITRDLRQSAETQINISDDGNPYDSVSFNVSEGVLGSGAINWSTDEISFTLSSGQVIRTQGLETRVLANNITLLSFTRYPGAPDVVRINLAAQKMAKTGRLTNASLSTSALLRN